MTAQTLFSILVLILSVTVGLSLGFSVKPMVLCVWRAGREVDWRDAVLLRLCDAALILTASIVAFAWVVRWCFRHQPARSLSSQTLALPPTRHDRAGSDVD
jgi:hypothetical protein